MLLHRGWGVVWAEPSLGRQGASGVGLGARSPWYNGLEPPRRSGGPSAEMGRGLAPLQLGAGMEAVGGDTPRRSLPPLPWVFPGEVRVKSAGNTHAWRFRARLHFPLLQLGRVGPGRGRPWGEALASRSLAPRPNGQEHSAASGLHSHVPQLWSQLRPQPRTLQSRGLPLPIPGGTRCTHRLPHVSVPGCAGASTDGRTRSSQSAFGGPPSPPCACCQAVSVCSATGWSHGATHPRPRYVWSHPRRGVWLCGLASCTMHPWHVQPWPGGLCRGGRPLPSPSPSPSVQQGPCAPCPPSHLAAPSSPLVALGACPRSALVSQPLQLPPAASGAAKGLGARCA